MGNENTGEWRHIILLRQPPGLCFRIGVFTKTKWCEYIHCINSLLANGFRGMKQSSSCYGVVVRPTPSRYCPASQLRMSASPVMTSSVLPSRAHTGSCT